MEQDDKTINYNCPTCEDNFVRTKATITEVIKYPTRFYWCCKYCNDAGFAGKMPFKNKSEYYGKYHWRRYSYLR